MNPSRSLLSRLALLAGCLVPLAVQAQWLTQTVRLKPGWNAVFLHVDASYTTLDELIPNAADPVAEIWLWRPTPTTMQFVDSPDLPRAQSSRWSVWTAARGDGDTLTRLIGNAAYLVRNSSTADKVWTIKGRPVPPDYNWTSTGLNFVGFSTPAAGALTFDKFLAPAPGLDPARSVVNGVQIIRYPGGDLDTNNVNPRIVSPIEARSVVVNRGEAFWIRANTNYYNRYYAPVAVSLQNPSGVHFGDSLGTYAIRFKNLTASNRTVTLNLAPSETPPTGQTLPVAQPPLLVRGDRNPTNFTYAYTALSGNTFTLAPDGSPGAELEVVLGLNRAALTAVGGSLYAGVLRITDNAGFEQIDLPVTATVPNRGGLWVGNASVTQVGEYLKDYPRVTTNQPPPRASFLDLDGSGSAVMPKGISFSSDTYTVEGWVRLRTGQELAPFAGLRIVPEADPNSPGDILTWNLTSAGGRLAPAFPAPLIYEQAMLPPDGSNLATKFMPGKDFGGTNSIGGQVVSFDVTINASSFGGAGVVFGQTELQQSLYPPDYSPHFGLLFRADGDLEAYSTPPQVAFAPKPKWTTDSPNLKEHHVDVICSDPNDGNPFDGVGSTKFEVFVDGNPTPVFTHIRTGGGFAQNFMNFQNYAATSVKFRNVSIGRQKPVVSATYLAPGAWTHVAYVAQAGTARIYVNGTETASGPAAPAVNGFVGEGVVGGTPNSPVSAAAGFDDVRIWSIARTANEIRRDMALGHYPAGTPGLLAQYEFPATGSPGFDSSGNSQLLNLIGTARIGFGNFTEAETKAANLAVAVASANRQPTGSEIAVGGWTNLAAVPTQTIASMAVSEDGKRLLMTRGNNGVFLSVDAGATFSQVRPSGYTWSCVAIAGDGSTMLAGSMWNKLQVSRDSGLTWTERETSRTWRCAAVSETGQYMVAAEEGGNLHASQDFGVTWSPAPENSRSWREVTCSADGRRMVAVAYNSPVFVSTDAGATWEARGSTQQWTCVAASADGLHIIAGAQNSGGGGPLMVSTDGGFSWSQRDTIRTWSGVASSADGTHLLAVALRDNIYASDDGGLTWSPQDRSRNWERVVSTAEGTFVAASTYDAGVFVRGRRFTSYEIDPESGLIRSPEGTLISTGVNTNFARTASPFPLRLILHADPAASEVKLLPRAFVGRGATTTNTVIATRELLLDADHIGSARRLSAAHLPAPVSAEFWKTPGQIQSGTTLKFTVPLSYNEQSSNPFLHTFHPDHDNLRPDFKGIEAVGVESYDITREVRLTVTPPGNDFQSLTASSLSVGGIYEETITLGGKAGAQRTFRIAGSFSLQRISPIDVLTTP